LDSAFARAHITEFFDRILAGIEDEQDIRTLCNLMTAKMINIAPEETQRNLDSLSEHYRIVLSIKPKDNAVKQELEKAQEASLGILKISRELDKAFPTSDSSGEHLKWNSYMDWIRKTFGAQLRVLDSDS
jgi:cullin-associated NEDD8-dissociated protein 1